MKKQVLLALILFSLLSMIDPLSHALEPEVIYEFSAPPVFPNSRLIEGPDGSLYGTTRGGGGGWGTVYKISKSGNIITLASFDGINGSEPQGPLVLDADGSLYGAASDYTGTNSTIFRVGSDGSLATLIVFNDTNGAFPESGLIAGADGNLYGTTLRGGSGNMGTVFRTSKTGQLLTLASFDGANGAYPGALVFGEDGSLYGTTHSGGRNDLGTIFKITDDGTLTLLASFDGTTGAGSAGAMVIGADGSLYGVSEGSHFLGAVFRLTPTGVLTVMDVFNGMNGSWPASDLALGSDGKLYGVTGKGGENLSGTIFRVSTNAFLETIASLPEPTEFGLGVNGLTAAADGSFYVTTENGGPSARGSVLKVTPQGVLTTVTSFANPDGNAPCALVLGKDGSLYGTTFSGGTDGHGTLFRLTMDGTFTTLASFLGHDSNVNPSERQGLLTGLDGAIYGTTQGGPIFKASTNGSLSTLVLNSIDHGAVISSLLMGKDGALYGTTVFESEDWLYGGTVFKATIDGAVTTLVTFDGTNNGAVPKCLAFGADGNLYGMTFGESGKHVVPTNGTVFKVMPDGSLATLASFPSTNHWWGLSLTPGNDGNFYGTIEGDGGTEDPGALIKLTTNGVLTVVVQFNGTNGAGPIGPPTARGDGSFFGMTSYGGKANRGTVFQFSPDGTLTTLASFDGTVAYPFSQVVLGNDGNLYGASAGGRGGGGTIFRLTLPRLLSVTRNGGGDFLLTGKGPANDSYRLWGAIDLSEAEFSWTLVTSGFFDSLGNFSFTDSSINRMRFYKLSVP